MATYLIHAGPNPTSDFYFPERDRAYDINLLMEPEQFALESSDTLIFIRYINSMWRRYLSRLPFTKRPKIVFFIDDDVFDRSMHKSLPRNYRKKLHQQAGRHSNWLKKVGAQLWVSNPWLANKYKEWNPQCLPPQNPYKNEIQQQIVFYHGSASHGAEVQWLKPVMEEVLNTNRNLSFEIIGNLEVRNAFRNSDRVHVLHPMAWTSYRALISTPGRIVGLAPLVNNPFNQARSATKFFDITQAGAVGVYADHFVYNSLVVHRSNGYLLEMNEGLWIESILALAEDEKLRKKMLEEACKSVAL